MLRYELPELPYAYDALEPHVPARTMELHHRRHHAAYVNAANAAVEELTERTDAGANGERVGAAARKLAFNLGGHQLHSTFWRCMCPGGSEPEETLLEAASERFGDIGQLVRILTSAATTVPGSGWGALVWDPLADALQVMQIGDHQNHLCSLVVPLLVIDVWEHAYYAKYENNRADWVENFFWICDWASVSTRLMAARSSGHAQRAMVISGEVTTGSEQRDAFAAHVADRPPTAEEAALADDNALDDGVAAHYREMARLGANAHGEGRIE